MRIGFVEDYSNTHYAIRAMHYDIDSIPNLSEIPTYVELPGDFEFQDKKLALYDKITMAISFVNLDELDTQEERIAKLEADNATYAAIIEDAIMRGVL